MGALLTCFAVALIATLWIARLSRDSNNAAHDSDLTGPQKIHASPVPRIGGVAVVCGLIAAAVATGFEDRSKAVPMWLLLACATPCFAAGLVEDFTKAVSARRRLASTALSAIIAVAVLQSTITYTSIPGLDWIVAMPLGAAVVTAFVVTGVASAINIIDGLNGLSSMCAALVLAGVAYVAMQVGDMTVAWLALAGICALFGFFVLNYPGGRVFLGDGGAYVVGFYVAEVGILLLHRNPQVSPLCPLLLCIYPVFETVFSMYRRRVLRARSPGLPDGIHLHSLIYRRLMRWSAGAVEGKRLTRRNSMTSPYLWLLCMLAVLPAMLFWDNTALLGTLIVVFGFAYTLLYWRIVRFRSPRWLRALARARRPVGEVPGQG